MNKNMDKKLDLLLADMPKPEYDLDAWLTEDESEEFDRLQRMNTDTYLQRTDTDFSLQHLHGSKRKMWRWVAAAACLIIIIGIGMTVKQISTTKPEPMLVENNVQPLPSLVGNCEEGAIGERSDGGAKPGPGVGSVISTPHIEPQGEAQTTHQKELQTPPLARPKNACMARTPPHKGRVQKEVAARTIAKNSLSDTLGTSIWQRRENVIRAVQLLSNCEADIRQEEQEIRNGIVEATFRATPQPKNAILVTNEAGDYEVIETRSIIEI